MNRQDGPYPSELADLIDVFRYHPGWTFELVDELDRGQGSVGLTLDIVTTGWHSYHPPALHPDQFGPDASTACAACGEPFPCAAYERWPGGPRDPYRVHHYMPVPPAAYNRQSWQRWLFEQCQLVDRHEACEMFTVDGEKPYAPNHGPGWDPYLVTELTTELDRRTSFRGEANA